MYNYQDLEISELRADVARLEEDAESLRNTITSLHLSLKERDAEIKKIEANADYHADKNVELVGEIERLKAESEAYRQGFIRVGCENAKLQAVVDVARKCCDEDDSYFNVTSDLSDAIWRLDTVDATKQDTTDGS